MSDMGALPQFELPRSDDQNHTEPCKAKHQAALHQFDDAVGGIEIGVLGTLQLCWPPGGTTCRACPGS